MVPNLTAVERAFQLARSGKARDTNEIRRVLKAEGYSDQAMVGSSILRQLRDLIERAKAKS
jgi:hypothetical protein